MPQNDDAECKRLVNEGALATRRDNPQLAADKFLEATLKAPSKWWKDRYKAFLSFGQICKFLNRSQPNFGKKNHYRRILKQNFYKNEEEPVLYRVEAAITLACFKMNDANVQDQADYYRDAIELIQGATDEEKSRRIMAPTESTGGGGPSSLREVTVGQELDKILEILNSYLEHHEGPQQHGNKPTAVMSQASPFRTDPDLFRRATQLGGGSCDCCGKTKQELGLSRLQVCSRCGIAFYCSKECQVQQWKAGHKQACRKKRQIQPGDIMYLVGFSSSLSNGGGAQLNGQFVQAVQPDPDQEHASWQIKLFDRQGMLTESTMTMPVKHLQHIRPAK